MEEVSRWKWNTESTFRLPTRPLNLFQAYSDFGKVLAVFNRAKSCICFHSLLDYSPCFIEVPITLPEDVLGVPILSWNAATSLALIFPSFALVLDFTWPSSPISSVTLHNTHLIALGSSPNSIHWMNKHHFIVWNNSHFSLVSLDKNSVILASCQPVTSVSSFTDELTGSSALFIANERLLTRIEFPSLQTTKFVLDYPISHMAYKGDLIMYAYTNNPAKMWPSSEFTEVSTSTSVMTSLLSVGASLAEASTNASISSIVEFSTSNPTSMKLHAENDLPPPSSIDHFIVGSSTNYIAVNASASSSVYFWDLTPRSNAQSSFLEKLTLAPSNTRILGLKLAKVCDIEGDTCSDTRLYVLVGEIVPDPMATFMASNRDFNNLQMISFKIPATKESNVTSVLPESDPLAEIKSRLFSLAMEEAMAGDDLELPIVYDTPAESSPTKLKELETQIQTMNTKIDLILSNQNTIISSILKMSSDLQALSNNQQK